MNRVAPTVVASEDLTPSVSPLRLVEVFAAGLQSYRGWKGDTVIGLIVGRDEDPDDLTAAIEDGSAAGTLM